MHNSLYIPDTITVGFVKRPDTFTGKLAYIIYTDEKGKLRKEASWQSWRDATIEPLTFANTPTPNFTFNKGVQRDGHWGSGRSVIRVWDPRDFEFEVSIDNLIGLLMHSDVSKRDIVESCVYAWNGVELVLLPTNSVEYTESMKHTEKQSKKVSAKELTPGYSYGVKKENRSVVYLGYFERYESATETAEANPHSDYYYQTRPDKFKFQCKLPKKHHMFIDPATKHVYAKNPTTWLATVDTEEVHPDFAALCDVYYSSLESQPFIGMSVEPMSVHAQQYSPEHDRYWVIRGFSDRPWFALSDTEFVQISFGRYSDYNKNQQHKPEITRFARYHADLNKLELSYDASVNSTHNHYMRSVTWSANNLDGLSKTDSRVVKLFEWINTLEHEYGLIVADTHHTANNRDTVTLRAERLAEIAAKVTKMGGGMLAYVLANGKNATDYKL